MLLTGSYDRNVDEKLRLALPKPIRDCLGSENRVIYIAPGTDGSLALYPEGAFKALAEKLADASPNASGVRSFSRLFFARAQRVEIDKSGRIRVPNDLAELGCITKAVVLVGVRDHIELWDKERWDAYLHENEPIYDDIAERAFDAQHGVSSKQEPEREPAKPLPR